MDVAHHHGSSFAEVAIVPVGVLNWPCPKHIILTDSKALLKRLEAASAFFWATDARDPCVGRGSVGELGRGTTLDMCAASFC